MTFRELFREFVAGFHSRRALRDLSITQAWLTVALALGSKGLPPLERLLGVTTAQTPLQQRSMLQQIAARYGIELEQTRLIHKPLH